MQLYQITNGSFEPQYRETLSEAHTLAKTAVPREDVRIRLFDYPSDKAALCALFNRKPPAGEFKRAWILSNRGGLVELSDETARKDLEVDTL